MKLSIAVSTVFFVSSFLHHGSLVQAVKTRSLSEEERKGKAMKKKKKKKKDKKGKKEEPEPEPVPPKVIIGGAGFSGISAAKTFADFDGDLDFAILEATDRVGGRARSAILEKSYSRSFTVPEGANSIIGLEGNPIWELALRFGVEGSIDNFIPQVYDTDGNFDPDETLFAPGTTCGDFIEAFNGAQQISRWCLQPGPGVSLNSTVAGFCREILGLDFVVDATSDLDVTDGQILFNGFCPPVEDEAAIAQACEFFGTSRTNGARNDQASLKFFFSTANMDDFAPGVFYVHDERGYEWIAEKYAAQFLYTSVNNNRIVKFDDGRLQLQTKVVAVKWDPYGVEPVEVTCCITQKIERRNSYTRFRCRPYSEETVYADYFMSTFSVGVLKQSLANERRGRRYPSGRDFAPVFDPPLRSVPALATAIDTAGFSRYAQVFMRFPFRFWPANIDYFISAFSQGHFIGDFAPLWKPLDYGNQTVFLPGSNILYAILIDRRADQVTTMKDSDVVTQLLPVLNGMFGDSIKAQNGGRLLTAYDVEDVSIARWNLDPLYQGMYMYRDVLQQEFPALGMRYGNLIFSGEYSCDRHGGSTQGALFAGERSASRLLYDKFNGSVPEPSLCDEPMPESRRMQAEDSSFFLKSFSPKDLMDYLRQYETKQGM